MNTYDDFYSDGPRSILDNGQLGRMRIGWLDYRLCSCPPPPQSLNQSVCISFGIFQISADYSYVPIIIISRDKRISQLVSQENTNNDYEFPATIEAFRENNIVLWPQGKDPAKPQQETNC